MARTNLARAMRDKMDLTGTKGSCCHDNSGASLSLALSM
jgi:aerobic-type carbon monoxide dehydrogenase small subunit (CoxS/CutS family)